MVAVRLGSEMAHGCPQCRGAFLSHPHAARVRSGVERVAPVQAEQAALGVPRIDPRREAGPLACPFCRVAMRPEWIPERGVRLDACPAHGVFFDAHELLDVMPEGKRPVAQARPGHQGLGEAGLELIFGVFLD